MKTNLLNQIMLQAALETVDQTQVEAAAVQGDTAPAPSAPEEKMVQVEGPLSMVYARALDVAFAVPNPNGLVVDNPHAVSVAMPTVESAAMDEMIAMQAHATTIERLQNLVHSGDGDSLRVYTTGAATSQDQADANKPSAQDVFSDLSNFIDSTDPVNFVFVETLDRPSEDSPISASGTVDMIVPGGKVQVGTEEIDVIKTGEVPSAVPERGIVVEGPQGDTVQPAAQGARILVQDTYLTDPQRLAYDRSRNAQAAYSPDPAMIPTSILIPMGTKADEPKLVNTEPGVYSNFAIESITVIIKTKRVN